MKLRSVKAKMLLTVMVLSLVPMVLFGVISRVGLVDVRERMTSELIDDARKGLVRLAADQAAIANAMLDKVAAETRMLAFSAETLVRNPAAFDDLDLFALIREGDDNLGPIYYGTQSGGYREYSRDAPAAGPGFDPRIRPWYLNAASGNDVVWTKYADAVERTDVLTCSRAVKQANGRLAGVVAMDIGMAAISGRIIHTPEDVPGYAFLMNERGELVEQEKPDMFIPAARGSIRRTMTAGETGIAFDKESGTYVAFAPIRSIHSPDARRFWSVGVSMPQREITRLAGDIQQRLARDFSVLLGILAVMFVVATVAAVRMSNRITGPLLEVDAGAKRIGSGELDHRLHVRTGDEIETLADTFNKMAGDLKTYIRNLKETTAEKERFESELRVAHEIQMSLLKKIFPPFPQRSDFSLYAALEPAREVGGDLYDFALVGDNRLVFYVGDVSDKGVPAALVMAMTMSLMRRAAQQPGVTPAEILRQVNAAVAEENENAMFVTLFVGILDLRTGELCFSNAGHNPPLILDGDGRCRFLPLPDGLVLGVTPDAEYRDDVVRLERGEAIVVYTDGVTEAMNPDRTLYSEERLRATVAALAGRSVTETVDEIVASVHTHAAGARQSDDIAVLTVRRT